MDGELCPHSLGPAQSARLSLQVMVAIWVIFLDLSRHRPLRLLGQRQQLRVTNESPERQNVCLG